MRQIPGQASGILSYFTRHPTVANLLLVILVVAGLLAGPNMRAQFFPDVIDDDVTVNVRWDGAGAEDVDSGIVQLLEPTLLAVEGVVDTSSMSREGSAEIELEFEPGYDMMKAVDDVETAIDTVTDLPEDADDPTIRSGGWRDRVTDVVITGPVAVDQLGRFADEFVIRLFAEGVTRTTIRGVAAPQVVVEVPSRNLIGHDVTMQEISDAIAGEVNANPAGDVSGANARVRTGVETRSAEAIEAIVLRSEADGTKLTIGDVARVRREGIDRARTYFVGDNPAISVRVDRSAQGDAIEIQRQVEEVARDFQASLPEGTRVDLIRTRAEAISGRLNILLDNGAMGLVLVVVLLFLFLNARIAIWVAAGIPTAMLAALALMYASGLTINMISLFALIITLGIVVDDAIVVGEHADHMSRHGGPGAGGRDRRAAHGAAGVLLDADHDHRLLRPDRHRRALRRHDPGHSLHRHHGADRLAGGMLPDPAQPHGPCHRLGQERALVRPALAAGESRLPLGARAAVPAAHGGGDPGALRGAGARGAGLRLAGGAVHPR